MRDLLIGLLIGIGLTLGVLLSATGRTLDSPWWTGLAGVIVGALLAALFAFIRDRLQRQSDARDVAETIYVELVDRVSRCCFDYDLPFKLYTLPNPDFKKNRSRNDLVKFRPTVPVIYPTLGAKLALLPTNARNHVVQFFSSLDRWQREIDDINLSKKELYTGSDLIRVQRRLGETLPFAERALEALAKNVNVASEVEAAAYEGIYLSVFDERRDKPSRSTLRETLSELRQIAEASKRREWERSKERGKQNETSEP